MASQFDLAPRLAALQALGFAVASDYRTIPLRWLAAALVGCDLRVINVKGTSADETPVLLRLAHLEALLATAAQSAQLHNSIESAAGSTEPVVGALHSFEEN
jgi:hypothetical protein